MPVRLYDSEHSPSSVDRATLAYRPVSKPTKLELLSSSKTARPSASRSRAEAHGDCTTPHGFSVDARRRRITRSRIYPVQTARRAARVPCSAAYWVPVYARWCTNCRANHAAKHFERVREPPQAMQRLIRSVERLVRRDSTVRIGSKRPSVRSSCRMLG